MLHTDREEVERRLLPASDESQPMCSGGIHAGLARKAVELLLETPGGRDFARRWLFGMALRDQQAFCLANALRWADDGVRWFANDAELLLARGTIQEALATLVGSVPGLAGLSPRARDMARSTLNERRYRLAGARRSFESALAADPGLHEARLRLGRVAWHLEQKDAARSAFESVLSRAAEPGVLYLARLYLGRVAEDARRLEEAEGHYREALALEPQGQAAAVALSHVLGLAGDPAAAREVLQAAVSRAGSRTLADPFWAYLSGRSDEGDAILDELRRESHR
jgi:tetratricopeptide (TPR) repeat protein